MEAEVLIVGKGIAGCSSALAAAQNGAEVLVVSKGDDTSTSKAQGGIAVSRGNPEKFKKDIIEASSGYADKKAVEKLVKESDNIINNILIDKLGIPFEKNKNDKFDYAKEGGHSESRILHIDANTGKHIQKNFLSYIKNKSSITILQNTSVIDLINREDTIYGAILDREKEIVPCYAGATILATGGIGAIYPNSTNPWATGDGIALAALAGADINDMEFVQFHPTVYSGEDPFLLSEALRGEGALLFNANGERFMSNYHPDGELAPRDIASRAVQKEIQKTGNVVLDVSSIDFKENFPTLVEKCEKRGIDWKSDIPVAPAEHFLCGGINVNEKGETNLPRLFAAGECARTGVHGANRLASTSLLEGLIWGLEAGKKASEFKPKTVDSPDLPNRDPELPEGLIKEKFSRLRKIMGENLGPTRNKKDIDKANSMLRKLNGEIDSYVRARVSVPLYELRFASLTGFLISKAASERKKSIGCHYIEENPQT